MCIRDSPTTDCKGIDLVWPPQNIPLYPCEEDVETIWLHFKKCHYNIEVKVHIKGPEYVEVTKEGAVIEVPNPWISCWANYTWHFWATIKEDIAGKYFDTWHGKEYLAPGSTTVKYMVPNEVPTPDCKVDIRDIALAARGFGSYPGHPRWNPVSDINGDYKIDIRDIAAIARQYGWEC